MVSLLIKKHDFAVFLTKTHHLKTLYIMTERVERIIRGRDTESSQLLFENIINRHRTDGVSCFLPREQPVVLSCLWIASKDVSTKYLVSSIRKDSITVRTVLAFGNIDTFL